MINQQETPLTPWNKLSIVSSAIGIVFIPIILAIIGFYVNQTIKSRESDTKLVEIAIDIVKQAPGDTEGSSAIRKWAIEVIDKHSTVKLPKSVKINLMESSLPTITERHGTKQAISYFIEPQLDMDSKKDLKINSTFDGLRSFQKVRELSNEEDGKMLSNIVGDVYGYVSPYDLHSPNNILVRKSPTLQQFLEIHRVSGRLFLVGRGLLD